MSQNNSQYKDEANITVQNELIYSNRDESSAAFEDLEQEEYVLLKDSNKRSAFLLKTSLLLLVYFVIMALACVYCRMDQRSAKNFQRTLRATDLLIVYALIGNGIFLAFGFGGKFLRDYAAFGYVIFCAIEFILCVGFYFYLEEVHRMYYRPYGHYLLINFMCLCVMQIVFSIMLIVRMKKNIHKFILIAGLMVVVDIVSLKIIEAMWTSNPLTFIELMIIFAMHSFIAVYVCINSYLLVKRRGDKFYEHECFYAFFTYFTDLFSFFWIDLIKIMSKKQKKIILKKPKKKRRKVKKVVQEIEEEKPQEEVHQRQSVVQQQNENQNNPKKQVKTTLIESQISKKNNQQNQNIENPAPHDRVNMDDSRDYEKLTTSNLD